MLDTKKTVDDVLVAADLFSEREEFWILNN